MVNNAKLRAFIEEHYPTKSKVYGDYCDYERGVKHVLDKLRRLIEE